MGAEHGRPTFDGTSRAEAGAKFAIVASRFNQSVVDPLLAGAVDALREHGVDDANVTVARVPGAWEIPLVCKWLCGTGKVDAVIALGAVIRGETPHFDYVAGEAARGCATAMMESGVPVVFGVLTTDDEKQAMARAQAPPGDNKGWDAALAAIEMVTLGKSLTDAGL
jgi:6,7-dimethyl-8-ribityllumazine synthase